MLDRVRSASFWKEGTELKKENDILEKTLDIAESGYDNAYLFLLDAYS